MEIIQVPQALPGCCFICRSGERKFFIDLQFNVDRDDNWGTFEGALYICSECLAEMASMANYSTPEKTEQLLTLITDQDNLLTRYKTQVEALEGIVNGYARLTGSDPGITTHDHSVPVNDEPATIPSEGAGEVGEGEGISSEPLHDEGMELVSNDASSGSEFRLNI